MPNRGKLWFKRRHFGWGWTPVTIEGWVIVLAYIVAVALMAMNMNEHSFSFYAGVFAVTLLLTAIGFIKGEAPKWQWGNRD